MALDGIAEISDISGSASLAFESGSLPCAMLMKK